MSRDRIRWGPSQMETPRGGMCVLRVAGITLMNSFLKITVVKPECHLATLCGIRSLTLLRMSPAEDQLLPGKQSVRRQSSKQQLGSCGQDRYGDVPAVRNLPAAEIVT